MQPIDDSRLNCGDPQIYAQWANKFFNVKNTKSLLGKSISIWDEGMAVSPPPMSSFPNETTTVSITTTTEKPCDPKKEPKDIRQYFLQIGYDQKQFVKG
jgi:hypothetical protein